MLKRLVILALLASLAADGSLFPRRLESGKADCNGKTFVYLKVIGRNGQGEALTKNIEVPLSSISEAQVEPYKKMIDERLGGVEDATGEFLTWVDSDDDDVAVITIEGKVKNFERQQAWIREQLEFLTGAHAEASKNNEGATNFTEGVADLWQALDDKLQALDNAVERGAAKARQIRALLAMFDETTAETEVLTGELPVAPEAEAQALQEIEQDVKAAGRAIVEKFEQAVEDADDVIVEEVEEVRERQDEAPEEARPQESWGQWFKRKLWCWGRRDGKAPRHVEDKED